MKLKEGHGFWHTDFYPIGGKFGRAPMGGLKIKEVIRTFKRYKAADTEETQSGQYIDLY